MHVTAIIAAAGSGRRLGSATPKQMLDIGGGSMLQHSVAAFAGHPRIDDIILVLPRGQSFLYDSAEAARPLPPIRIVAGGDRRQDSVANGFDAVSASSDVVLIHDAARPFVTADLIDRTIDAAARHGAAIAALQSRDTVKRVDAGGTITETIPRETIYLAQTPQGFRRDVLARAVAAARSGVEATDEAALAESAGQAVHVVDGDPGNVKITTAEDLETARLRMGSPAAAAGTSRVGTGYDLHRLVEGKPLVIGGVTIPFERGAHAHSDGDVACHAATDAILGAAGLGDIGRHFPDTDPKWKGADSLVLLAEAARLVREQGYEIGNVDITVILERPKIKDVIEEMRSRVARALSIDPACVSLKGKTNEGVDAVGRGEAIAAHATSLLRQVAAGSRPPASAEATAGKPTSHPRQPS
jgi:2-C-methyl-D-erythritol 4-phosphate cytidylyltransferase/2-C-methyl-D-erythritol 2,4-cyclodiphosphate synthase